MKILPLLIVLLGINHTHCQRFLQNNSISVNDDFYGIISKLEKVYENTFMTENRIVLYKEEVKEYFELGETEVEYQAVLKLNNQYLPLKLGKDHNILIKDIIGNKKNPEILINSGCFSDGGCLSETYLVIINNNNSFSFYNLGNAIINEFMPNKDKLSQKKDTPNKKNKFHIEYELFDEGISRCYQIMEIISYHKKKGLFKGEIFKKKLLDDCAG